MNKIDKYVNSIYKNIGGDKQEIKISKEEMKNHLMQFVEELKSEGKSEDESISIAIKSFGEEAQIENELLSVFKFANKKAKKILMAVVVFLIITITCFSIFLIGTEIYQDQYTARNREIFHIMSLYSKDNVDNINKNIGKVLDKAKGKISYVKMYRLSNAQNFEKMLYQGFEDKDLQYAYSKDIQSTPENTIVGQISSTKKEGTDYAVSIGFEDNAIVPKYIRNFKKISIIPLCCFIISMIAWILVKLDIHTKYRHKYSCNL